MTRKLAYIFTTLSVLLFVSSCQKKIKEERQPCNATIVFVLQGGEELPESRLVYFDASVDGEVKASLSIPIRTARREIRLELPRGESLTATATVFKVAATGQDFDEKEVDYYGELNIAFPPTTEELNTIPITISKK